MGEEQKQTRGERRRVRIAERARRIVESEYADPSGCNTRKIANRLGVSRSRLCRCYRERFDSTIGQDTRQRRIRLACRLIDDNPDRLVKQVAAEIGYGRRAYRTFFNSFQQLTGCSPREYRRRARSRRIRRDHDLGNQAGRQSSSSSA